MQIIMRIALWTWRARRSICPERAILAASLLLCVMLMMPAFNTAQTLRDLKPRGAIGNSKNDYVLGTYGLSFLPGPMTLISDKLEYKLKCFDKNGKIVRWVGKRGKLDGEFQGPGPVDATSNEIAVADLSSNRVQVFSATLQHKRTFYVENPVFSVRFDPAGHLWLGMLPNERGESLLEIDRDGQVMRKLALRNLSQNEFENIFQMTITGQGTIVIAYMVQNKVEVWDTTGRFVTEFSVGGIPLRPKQVKISRGLFSSDLVAPEDNLFWGVAADRKSQIYLLAGAYTEHPDRDIYVLDQEGRLISRLTLPENSKGIFIDNHDELYSIEAFRTAIRIYDLKK
jgi:hypothetical protein